MGKVIFLTKSDSIDSLLKALNQNLNIDLSSLYEVDNTIVRCSYRSSRKSRADNKFRGLFGQNKLKDIEKYIPHEIGGLISIFMNFSYQKIQFHKIEIDIYLSDSNPLIGEEIKHMISWVIEEIQPIIVYGVISFDTFIFNGGTSFIEINNLGGVDSFSDIEKSLFLINEISVKN